MLGHRFRNLSRMDTQKTIPRRQADPAGLDFASLRASGISLLQDMCGKTWTDYNLHDPGVTILEQLCYALTELNYRADFPIADLLTREEGGIDFEHQALYRPQDILPNQPLTPDDYRKLIMDRVPGVENVWFKTQRLPDSRSAGLYWVHVRLREPLSDSARYDPRWVRQQVCEVYAANRNLCEDLQGVRIVSQKRHTLAGRVELDGSRSPAEVLAEIYFRCARHVAEAIEFSPYTEMLAEGATLEDLFEGPLTLHGYIDGEQLSGSSDSMTIADIVGLASRIDGVRYAGGIRFLDETGAPVDRLRVGDFLSSVPYLAYPGSDAEIGVHLTKNGQQFAVRYGVLRSELERLHAEVLPVKRAAADLDALCALPRGTPRGLDAYYSIQHQFPALYGINAYGVPRSAPASRKAQAKQLKAYLLFFEQVLANGLTHVQQAARLYSLDDALDHSYFSQPLGIDHVPDIEAVYGVPAQARDAEVASVVASQDAFGDRRNRALDYLLSLYGEGFSQNSLRHFDAYVPEDGTEAELMRNKLRFLDALVSLSGRRAGAFNYLEAADCEDNHTTLVAKLSILLGLENIFGGPPSDGLRAKGLTLVEEGAWTAAGVRVTEAEAGRLLLPVPPGTSEGIDDTRLCAEVAFLKAGVVDNAVMRYGIDIDNYRMMPAGGDQAFRMLLLRASEDGLWYPVAHCASRDETVHLAYALRAFLVKLNVQCESILHVEHILLRPRGGHPFALDVDEGFFAFQLSLVLPAWTARCANPKFRRLVEESITLNCPAHLYPNVHWLGFDTMVEFEGLYAQWLETLHRPADSVQAMDAASERLTAFLHRLSGAG